MTCTSYEALLEAFKKKHTDTVGSEDLQGVSAKALHSICKAHLFSKEENGIVYALINPRNQELDRR